MRTIRVAGVDPSLGRTGVACLGYTPDRHWTVHTFDIPTASRESECERDKLDRMDYIVSSISPACEHADLLAIEGLAFHAKGRATRDLAGLWWLTYRRLIRLDVPVVVVTPSSVKKYAANHGMADKHSVSRAVWRMFPDVETSSPDQDDALVVAAIAADMAGLPVPYERPAYRRTALGAVAVPDDLVELD